MISRRAKSTFAAILAAGVGAIAMAAAAEEPPPSAERINPTTIKEQPSSPAGSSAPANGPVVNRPSTNSTINRAPSTGLIQQNPGGPPLGLPGQLYVTSPWELDALNGPSVVQTPQAGSTSLLTVLNPALVVQFPIASDLTVYVENGWNKTYPSVGVTGQVWIEACLTAQEAQAWSGATSVGADATTCPTENNPATASIVQRAWYQVAASAYVDAYVIQNSEPVNVPTPVPVNLQQIVVPLRFHIKGFVYYYPTLHTGPNNDSAACPAVSCGDGNFETRSNPLPVVVLPAFLFQLKVLPQTIIYLPPGNKSFGSYGVTQTYSTTLTAGATTEVDNSDTDDQWVEYVDDNALTAGIGTVVSMGYTSGTDTKFDTKTAIKSGQSLSRVLAASSQVQNVASSAVKAASTNVPGAGGTYATEPFWGDEVVVLVHPQFAVWDFYGRTSVQLIAASGTSILPDEVTESIADLDACANSRGAAAAGIQIAAADGAQVVLNASDCLALAVLDPFYGKGQSANVSARGTLFWPQNGYGIDPSTGDEATIDLKTVNSQQVSVTSQSTQTYSSTVEDIVATSASAGMNIGEKANVGYLSLGLTIGATLKQGSSIDTAQTMTMTYTNSSATTNRTDIAIEGSIDDTVNRGGSSRPQVAVYLDNVFGGLMPVDPNAPPAP